MKTIKNRVWLSVGVNILFPVGIFIIVAKLFAYVESYRATFVAKDAIAMRIFFNMIVLVAASFIWGLLFSRIKSKKKTEETM